MHRYCTGTRAVPLRLGKDISNRQVTQAKILVDRLDFGPVIVPRYDADDSTIPVVALQHCPYQDGLATVALQQQGRGTVWLE
jgi:hypothetical protein